MRHYFGIDLQIILYQIILFRLQVLFQIILYCQLDLGLRSRLVQFNLFHVMLQQNALFRVFQLLIQQIFLRLLSLSLLTLRISLMDFGTFFQDGSGELSSTRCIQ